MNPDDILYSPIPESEPAYYERWRKQKEESQQRLESPPDAIPSPPPPFAGIASWIDQPPMQQWFQQLQQAQTRLELVQAEQMAQQQLNYQLQLPPLANLSACEATAAFGKASPMLQQYNSQLNEQRLLHPNQCGTAQTLSGITNTASLNSIASSANLGTALPSATVASQAYGVSLGSLGNSLSELLRG